MERDCAQWLLQLQAEGAFPLKGCNILILHSNASSTKTRNLFCMVAKRNWVGTFKQKSQTAQLVSLGSECCYLLENTREWWL